MAKRRANPRCCVGRKPTSATSEVSVSLTPHGKPWETTSVSKTDADFKYQYYPGGNPANEPKDAPSALHSVIVPNVNLPKVCGVCAVTIPGVERGGGEVA